jgi:hypothetical protein
MVPKKPAMRKAETTKAFINVNLGDAMAEGDAGEPQAGSSCRGIDMAGAEQPRNYCVEHSLHFG